MVLSNEDRGLLENLIEAAIEFNAVTWLPYFRNNENRKHMQYKDGDDVFFGFIWGTVIASFLAAVNLKIMNGIITMDDLIQVREIVYNRSDEIRKKIMDSG
jgi:hypothetical protein